MYHLDFSIYIDSVKVSTPTNYSKDRLFKSFLNYIWLTNLINMSRIKCLNKIQRIKIIPKLETHRCFFLNDT